MGASLSPPSGGGGGPGRRRNYRQNAEINVTPLVDVMLVLLIIFMVSAPLLTVGVKVELPDPEAPSLNLPQEPLIVTRQADGKILMQETEFATLDGFAEALSAIAAQPDGKKTTILVRGDRDLDYNGFMELVSLIYRSGFQKIALETKPR